MVQLFCRMVIWFSSDRACPASFAPFWTLMIRSGMSARLLAKHIVHGDQLSAGGPAARGVRGSRPGARPGWPGGFIPETRAAEADAVVWGWLHAQGVGKVVLG
jgi:hypothetical protein